MMSPLIVVVLCNVALHTNSMQIYSVSKSDSILFECNGHSSASWKYEDEVLYVNHIPINERFGDSVVLFNNYSLYINFVSLSHEGTYECFRNSVPWRKYLLQVKVQHALYITYDESNESSSDIALFAGNTLSVSCHAIGAKPAANLTWIVNGRIANLSNVEFSVASNVANILTYNSRALLKVRLQEESGHISCVSNIEWGSRHQQVNASYKLYVNPAMVLTINDQNVSMAVYVKANETLEAACFVFGKITDATFKLIWLMNNVPTDYDQAIVSNSTRRRSILKSTLRFWTNEPNGTVTCVGKYDEVHLEQEVRGKFYTYVLPRALVININGQNESSVTYVSTSETIIASCHAYGSRPGFHLSWLVNEVETDYETFEVVESSAMDGTYDSISTLRYLPQGSSGSISCVSTFSKANVRQISTQKFHVYGIPQLQLAINGQNVRKKRIVNISEGSYILAKCSALTRSSAVNLTWLINGNKLDETIHDYIQMNATINEKPNNYFDTVATLKFVPWTRTGTIACVINGLEVNENSYNASFEVFGL